MEETAVINPVAGTKARRIHRIFTGPLAMLAIVWVAGATGCGRGSSSASPAAQTKGDASTGASARPASKRIDLKSPVVRIETSVGSIKLRLDGIRAPGTVRSFLNYANEGFYDNTLVHYVDPNNMILAGGYAAEGKPKPTHTPIRNEAHNGLKNVRGTIAMTRDPSQIDSATSQFFINLSDASQRDHIGDSPDQYGYCVFGDVTEGLEVADKISQSPTANRGGDLVQTPDPPVVIKSVRVVK